MRSNPILHSTGTSDPAFKILQRHQRRPLRHGFTLVELLVVIGIIALLISILLPTLTRAREHANAVQCAANLRQMGHAVVQYVVDSNNQYLPPYRYLYETEHFGPDPKPQAYFFEFLPGFYLKEEPRVMQCPSDTFYNPVNNNWSRGGPGWRRLHSGIRDVKYSYALNLYLPKRLEQYYPPYRFDFYNPSTLRGVRDPAQFIILVETQAAALLGHNSLQTHFRFSHLRQRGQNILFADGHVEALLREDFLPLASAPNDQNFWPDRLRIMWLGKADISTRQLN